ncbi:hypothetical protein ElyMa_004172000 [Elysia marginata]|uniref:Uncharacterized protein n=1 Tax=Elysia marginata TaxID=1093978 RepID=A0AAV4GHY1_9GAST|nr:hypothetical protein ElyMa_004172000 [Elysia marginata]
MLLALAAEQNEECKVHSYCEHGQRFVLDVEAKVENARHHSCRMCLVINEPNPSSIFENTQADSYHQDQYEDIGTGSGDTDTGSEQAYSGSENQGIGSGDTDTGSEDTNSRIDNDTGSEDTDTGINNTDTRTAEADTKTPEVKTSKPD